MGDRSDRDDGFRTMQCEVDPELLRRMTMEDERVPVLIVLHGQEIGRRYLLNQETLVVGRRPDICDLSLQGDPRVSSRHAMLQRIPDGFRVTDLGSTNGTAVGGTRLAAPRDIHDGDKLLIGNTVLKFTYQDEVEEDFHVRVQQMMNIDELTGLVVKRSFDQQCGWAVDTATRQGAELAVLMMDMDGLKKINDTHGHHVGAGTIATVGKLLGEIVNPRGCVTRFGGDEFTAFIAPSSREEGRQVAEQIRRAVETYDYDIAGVAARPTISIGLSSLPQDGTMRAQLIRAADAALYRAKAHGRNCVAE